MKRVHEFIASGVQVCAIREQDVEQLKLVSLGAEEQRRVFLPVFELNHSRRQLEQVPKPVLVQPPHVVPHLQHAEHVLEHLLVAQINGHMQTRISLLKVDLLQSQKRCGDPRTGAIPYGFADVFGLCVRELVAQSLVAFGAHL